MAYTLEQIQKKDEAKRSRMRQKVGDNSLQVQIDTIVKDEQKDKKTTRKPRTTRNSSKSVKQEEVKIENQEKDNFSVYTKRIAIIVGMILGSILATALVVKAITLLF